MSAAIRPADAAACAAALDEAARLGRSVRVRGGGTKDHLGDLRPADVVLETLALSGVVDHVAADLTVTAGAGTRLADLQRALAAAGQRLPIDPPHAAGATLGGIVATNDAGFGRTRYGGPRDLLIGTLTALTDGTVVRSGGRVVKNVAGYDLNKLLVGSLGTLGVVAETTFKVLPLPPARGALRARCRRAADAFAIADALARTSLRPSALVVERAGSGEWHVVVAAEGPAALVARTLAEAADLARRAGASS
ncbi:MAG TPA: FAD-binding protein, partial [Candidatus Limnocylindrales bacterium]|nr:FAD-binding protein [Candidatus Limnocylindrales bacterium]